MFKKILVPTDGSDVGAKAASVAAEMAKAAGGQVVGVYVIDPFPYIGIGDASAVGLQSYLSDAKRVAGAALEQVASACRAQGVPFAGDTIERNLVWEGILETAKAELAAQDSFDVVVVNSQLESACAQLVSLLVDC